MIKFASKRHHRRKSCEGKIRYSDHAQASSALYNQRLRGFDSNMHTYKCPYCHKYHIGHYSEWKKNMGRE